MKQNLIYRFLPQTIYEGPLFTSKSWSYEENPRLSIGINKDYIHREKRHIFCHVEGHEEASKVSTENQNENSFNNIENINQAVSLLSFNITFLIYFFVLKHSTTSQRIHKKQEYMFA